MAEICVATTFEGQMLLNQWVAQFNNRHLQVSQQGGELVAKDTATQTFLSGPEYLSFKRFFQWYLQQKRAQAALPAYYTTGQEAHHDGE